MFHFVAETYGPGALQEAWEEFVGAEERFEPETPHNQVFMPWFFHFWSPDPHGTLMVETELHERRPTELFLERRGARLDPVLRRYLEFCLEAPFSFYEILRVDPGHGFHARDLFTGAERAVQERMASPGMQSGNIVFGQLVTAEGITMLEASSMFFWKTGLDNWQHFALALSFPILLYLSFVAESLFGPWRSYRVIWFDLGIASVLVLAGIVGVGPYRRRKVTIGQTVF